MAKALSRTVSIYVNGTQVKSTIADLDRELKKLRAQQRHLTIGTDEYVETALKIREIQQVIDDQKNAVKSLDNSFKGVLERVSEYSNMIMGVQSLFEMFDGAVSGLKQLAMDAAALDDAYGDVMKTTNMTHEEVEKLNEAFKRMDTRSSREELNKLAYEGGKLGISGQEAILGFVRAADKINIALGDVLGDGAMVTIGKLADIYSKSTRQLKENSGDIEKQMLAIGSAVNELGKVSTANEAYMVQFLNRMGGVATQAGLSADQILGFASALSQNNMAVEMSATALQKAVMQVYKKPAEAHHTAVSCYKSLKFS